MYPILNWLDLEGRRLRVIVTGRKTAYWHCGEMGHLSAICPGKKVPQKTPDHIQNAPPPATAKSKTEAPIVSPAVGTLNPGTIREKNRTFHPETSNLVADDKSKEE